MYLFLERCRKSKNVWLRALMQSDCLYSSLFFEHLHYSRIHGRPQKFFPGEQADILLIYF